ncbi:uncharacterized protein LOC126971384 isoform X2 [Leptidea sinapis]|uniref:uncharacterized protein LOC126971384 isoform X2 n=1 Tax=Leptidea sinapis TaxID=189913 RepID=UPI0021251A02|nr:uncharacterized protein LOC126971384 isoform X2 [Leptidea sinapis]
MSFAGRGRGYSGRHHARETRPGDVDTDELNAVRTLAELSPRSTDATKVDMNPDLRETEVTQERVRDNDNDDELNSLLYVDDLYSPLLVLLDQFAPGEDGIQFNRKLRQFENTVTELCPDETRLQQAFASFRGAALQSAVTSRKLATVGAAFTRQQRQGMLRTSLLNIMQGTFSKLEVLERANPVYLINAANLIGDYFAEARLCNGKKVHILAAPLLKYLRAMLTSDDVRAHRSLATQLMQNGRELLSILSQELDELSNAIRLRLLSPPKPSIIWLLLSADLCLNKFLPLPNTLQQFYAAHLDLSNEESFSEVSYGSWKSPDKEIPENISQNLSQISLNQDDDAKPKLRPILGAGAATLRQDTDDSWNTKSSLSKRYDLNSWRQEEEEPVFNPAVPPPNFVQDIQSTVNYTENYSNYLQQGDGTYIQSYNYPNEGVPQPEKVHNEMQKACRKDEGKKNNWNKHSSDDNINEEEQFRSASRTSRESKPGKARTDFEGKNLPKRHVSDVPRNQKYWDHDDRCDKDYNS